MEYWRNGVLERCNFDKKEWLMINLFSSTPLLQHFKALLIQMRKKLKDLNKK